MRYTAGFLFTENLRRVALILKNKPDWQRGKLNAIGGKVEDNEDSRRSMEREFEEETGVLVQGWRFFAELHSPTGDVIHFASYASELADRVGSPTEEKVFLVEVASVETGRVCEGLPMPNDGGGLRAIAPAMYNLPWLVRMGVESSIMPGGYTVHERKFYL